MASNKNLNKAGQAKKDEFYTQIADIEREMRHYAEHFKGKTIFCNCDDPATSNFWLYFELNFIKLGLKKLIATHYETTKPSYKLTLDCDINGDGNIDKYDIVKTPLKEGLRQNGDFRSQECIELLKEADIVITNPPFSLFREYMAQLMEYEKKFIIISNQNALHYKEIFPLIMSNKIWLGNGFRGNVGFFSSPYEDYAVSSQHKENLIRISGVIWLTNLDIEKRHERMILYKKYTKEEYPTYENYDAIEVSKTADIPEDYYGCMGVPDTFLQQYNPEQFEIIGLAESELGKQIGFSANLSDEQCAALFQECKSFRKGNPIYRRKDGTLHKPYSRIIIRRKKG